MSQFQRSNKLTCDVVNLNAHIASFGNHTAPRFLG
jgi:hypothetical protein